MSSVRLVLPVPPSANALFTYRAGSRQRIKTDAYRAWINEAAWAVAAAGPIERARHPWKPWRVDMDIPFDRRRDLDNAIKPVLDLLVRMGLMKDDRWVDDLRVRRIAVGEPLVVSIWSLEG